MQILTRLNQVIAYSTHDYIPVGNTAVCPVTGERYDDAHIVSVDCVPTDIDCYNYHYIDGKFVKGYSKFELRETNRCKHLFFWVGTQAEYDVLPEKLENCFYIITDDKSEKDLMEAIDQISKRPYMVEQGTDGPWFYEKWSNGVSKCWGMLNDDFQTGFGSSDTGSAKATYHEYTCPFIENLFIDTPLVFVTACDGGSGLATASNDNSNSVTCKVTSWGAEDATNNGNVNIFAVGRWQ